MFWVDGRIIAEGTENDSITFTRAQDSLYYHWGIIYITEQADLCSFKYCNLEYSARILIVLGIIPTGAICVYNGKVIVEDCTFLDNMCGIDCERYPDKILVKNSKFYSLEYLHPDVPEYGGGYIRFSPGHTGGVSNPVLIAGNRFYECNYDVPLALCINRAVPVYFVNNFILELSGGIYITDFELPSYIYKNEIINCFGEGIRAGSYDTLFIKENRIIEGTYGLHVAGGYVEISDNYFEECDLYTDSNCYG